MGKTHRSENGWRRINLVIQYLPVRPKAYEWLKEKQVGEIFVHWLRLLIEW